MRHSLFFFFLLSPHSLYFAVGAFVAALETRESLREQGACCEQRPAALKRRSPVQTPARRPTPARLCQATPQPAGSDLQLQHLSRISSSATTLRSQQVRVVEGGGGDGGGAGARWCPWTRPGSWSEEGSGGVVLLIYCRAAFFCSLSNWRFLLEKNKQNNNGSTRRPSSEWHRTPGPPTLELSRMIYVRNALLK